MKTFRSITIRLILGLLLGALLVVGLFALTLSVIPIWGSTNDEVARSLPGDDLTAHPLLFWTNAITIDASQDQVWPWIAQIGDTRGGFYSYTFIENQVGALTGAEGYDVIYTNANQIHPEWQNPQPGEPIIQGSLKINQMEPGRYLLADSILPSPFMWVWVWYLEPLDGGTGTRLLSRFAIEVPESAEENPVMNFVMSVGGFVMQQNMMQSIKLRAEGQTEPAWLEPVEIGLWLIALFAGLTAAIMYLARKIWWQPLIVAVLSVVVIFVLTFVQPPILVRFLLDAGLIAGIVWSAKSRIPTFFI